jgi:leader peptidase (prepilin peptidase)/N-methyltransferase
VILYVFVIGSVVGSFLNVLVYRVPRRMSIISPGSSCPSCGTAIRWYDNVPLLSWIVLRARCRKCSAAISIRYPAVEAAAGLIALLSIHTYGIGLEAFEAAAFAWVSLALGLIDLEHQILPDVMTYPSIVFGLVCAWFGGLVSFPEALLGAAVGAGLPILVILVYKLWRGVEGMGWGDVKYLAAIGAVVGLHDCLWVLVIAAVVGAIVGLVLIVLGRGSGKTALPFGTFLALAAILWLYLPSGWVSWIVP